MPWMILGLRTVFTLSMIDIKHNILEFCRSGGYLSALEKKNEIPESERFDTKRIDKKGLDILDAINCLLDTSRTNFFAKEISRTVKRGDRVLEAGIGTGILSYFALLAGAQVVGLELNRKVLNFSRRIRNYLKNKLGKRWAVVFKERLKFSLQNAITYKSSLKFDGIISENIYTGMFYEKQVQIMNNLLTYLKPNGYVIPQTLYSYFSLCEVEEKLLRYNHSLIVVQDIPRRSYKLLSGPIKYSSLDFRVLNKERVNFESKIKPMSYGVVNGLYITAKISMPSGKTIRGSQTNFFGNDIIVPIKKHFIIKNKKELLVKISYKFGSNPKEIKVHINSK